MTEIGFPDGPVSAVLQQHCVKCQLENYLATARQALDIVLVDGEAPSLRATELTPVTRRKRLLQFADLAPDFSGDVCRLGIAFGAGRGSGENQLQGERSVVGERMTEFDAVAFEDLGAHLLRRPGECAVECDLEPLRSDGSTAAQGASGAGEMAGFEERARFQLVQRNHLDLQLDGLICPERLGDWLSTQVLTAFDGDKLDRNLGHPFRWLRGFAVRFNLLPGALAAAVILTVD